MTDCLLDDPNLWLPHQITDDMAGLLSEETINLTSRLTGSSLTHMGCLGTCKILPVNPPLWPNLPSLKHIESSEISFRESQSEGIVGVPCVQTSQEHANTWVLEGNNQSLLFASVGQIRQSKEFKADSMEHLRENACLLRHFDFKDKD